MGVDLSFVENRLKIEKSLIKKRKKLPQTQLIQLLLNFKTFFWKKQSFFFVAVNVVF